MVRRPVNGGFGKAVNSGVAAATGEWVFILNSDLELDNSFVSRMLAAVERHGEILANPQIIGHDGKQQWVAVVPHRSMWVGMVHPLAHFKPTNWWHRGVGHDVEDAPAPPMRRSTGLWVRAWSFLVRPSTALVAWMSVST